MCEASRAPQTSPNPELTTKARDVPAPSLAGMRLFTAALWSGLGVQAGPGHLPSVLREDTGNSGPPSGGLSPLSGSFWLLSWLSGLPPLLPRRQAPTLLSFPGQGPV